MDKLAKPTYFATPADFRRWLEENHQKETELFVGYFKVGSGRQTMTWSESVDQAICFGWIDGIRKSIDKDSYCIRFTPRKRGSNWSAVNIRKVEELSMQGLMKPTGLAAFNLREESKSKVYTYENEEVKFSEEFAQLFKSNNKAWEYFQAMPPSYRKPVTTWVMSAKQETTRIKRLNELIRDSEAGRKIKPMSY